MKKIIIGMILLGLAGMASAELLAGYDFGSDTFSTAVTSNHVDITATDYTGAGTTPGLISRSPNWSTGNLDAEGNVFGNANPKSFGGKGHEFGYKEGAVTYADTLANSIANNMYMTFSVTPENDAVFDLTSFTFLAFRGRTASRSADQWALYSSVDGFLEADAVATGITTLDRAWEGHVVTLGDEFNNVSTTTEFRLYIYGATSASANRDDAAFDKVILNGVVIPEPATIGLLVISASTMLVIRRTLMV